MNYVQMIPACNRLPSDRTRTAIAIQDSGGIERDAKCIH